MENADSDKVAAFWTRLGAKVELMDAQHHDRVLAVTVKIVKLAISENGEEIGITLTRERR